MRKTKDHLSHSNPEQAIEHSLLLATLEATADGILVVDHAGKIVRFNERFAKMWKIPQAILDTGDDERAIGYVLSQLKDPDAFVDKVRELYANPGAESFDVLEFLDDRVFERYSIPQRTNGQPVGRVWSFRDVTQRVSEERQRAEAEDRARRRLERLESLWRLLTKADIAGGKLAETILDEGRRALELDHSMLIPVEGGVIVHDVASPLGITKRTRHSQRLDSQIASLVTAAGSTVDSVALAEAAASAGRHSSSKHPLRSAIGTPIRIGDRSYVLGFGSRTPRERPFTHEDREYVELLAAYLARLLFMSEQEGQITYLAYHDSLTGLENRRRFLERVNEASTRSQRTHRKFALMYIDLDRFKDVNDTLGHVAGDAVLCEAARRLRSTVRSDDAAARFGGDEFAVLLAEIASPAEVEEVARRVSAELSAAYTVDDREVTISASIGIAVFPEDGSSVSAVLGCADAALYRAKEQGRHRYCFYSQEIAARLHHRRQLQGGLRHALERGEFELHYQPVLRLSDGSIDASEALLRWNHPERGIVFPAEFIPAAEETGLMIPIGEWVMRAAAKQIGLWVRNGHRWRMAVNISVVQLQDANFLQQLWSTIDDAGIPPEFFEIEITESAALRDTDAAQAIVSECRRRGVRVALDDFGTHYASLSHLKKLPVDILKIDKSFVRGLPNDLNDAAIVRSVLALGSNFNCTVVAEGVESQEQLDWLRAHGCALAQGFLLAKPVSAAEFEAWALARQAPA